MSEKSEKKFLVMFKIEKILLETLSKRQVRLYNRLRQVVVDCDFNFALAVNYLICKERITEDFRSDMVRIVNIFKSIHKNSDKHPTDLIDTLDRVDADFITVTCQYYADKKSKKTAGGILLPLLELYNDSTNTDSCSVHSDLPLKDEHNQDVKNPSTDTDTVTDTDTDTVIIKKENKKEKKPKRFTPPSVDEVRAYCQEKNYDNVDPEYFVAYYEASNWTKGNNVKVQNWKALAKQWNLRTWNNNKAPPRQQPMCGMSQFFADMNETTIDITAETKQRNNNEIERLE